LDISPVLWRNVYSTAGVFSSTPAVLPITAVEGFYRLRVQPVKGAASHPSGTLFPTLQGRYQMEPMVMLLVTSITNIRRTLT